MKRPHWTRWMHDERGVALPLALIGLVSVSLLVTTALMSSSVELGISSAHRDATASLYASEGGLQEYVGRKVLGAQATPVDEMVEVTGDTRVPGFSTSVTLLFSRIDTLSDQTVRQLQTWSLLTEPTSGRGRGVVASVTTERNAPFFNLSVDAGITVGGDLSIGGNSTISDGRSADCDSATATNAAQVTAGATISKTGSARIEGVADTASYTKEEMVSLLLGGLSLNQAVQLATVKFAAGEFSGKPKSHDSTTPRPRSNKYNWGCPANSDDACTTVAGNGDNMAYFPMVAINGGGGKVLLEGDHGQGVLIVHNGSLEVRGNFVYEGIVLVEQDLSVKGTGGSSGVKIEGAVVSFGQNSMVEDNTTGNAVITYNQCIIATAQAEANQQRILSARQTFPYPLVGWAERVR